MEALLGLSSVIGFVVCVIMLVISTVKKNGKVKKWAIGITVCLVGFIIAVAMPSSSKSGGSIPSATTASAPAPASVPATVPAPAPAKPIVAELSKEGVSSDVKITVTSFSAKDSVGDNQFSIAKPQGVFKLVGLNIANNQKDAITITSANFKLIDDQGREFSDSSEAGMAFAVSSNKVESFSFKQLNPGMSIDGVIAFDVPKDAKGFKLKASGGMTGKPITLKVE